MFVDADRSDLVPTSLEPTFRVIDRNAFEEKEPDPSWIEHKRKDRGASFCRSKTNHERLPAVVDRLPRARKSRVQLLKGRPGGCRDLRRISFDGFIEILLFCGHLHSSGTRRSQAFLTISIAVADLLKPIFSQNGTLPRPARSTQVIFSGSSTSISFCTSIRPIPRPRRSAAIATVEMYPLEAPSKRARPKPTTRDFFRATIVRVAPRIIRSNLS